MALNILYVGEPDGTCRHRAEALRQLGHRVLHVPAGLPGQRWARQLHRIGHHLGQPPDLRRSNRAILARLRGETYDVLWVDKGMTLRASTLARAREASPRTALVAYSPDDMYNRANQTRRWRACVPHYDLHVTTKSYNVEELAGLGARDVFFVDNAFDPATHRPVELSDEERAIYRADVGFIGFYEEERAESMYRLAREGIEVVVWGIRWERCRQRHPKLVLRHRSIWEVEYAKAIGATRINLGFLRKVNRDLQTTRSVEIPACGAFMLAERTDEHLRLFEEGREAEYFGSFDELLRKCRYYLEHEDERRRIAAAGLRRCLDGGYSNRDRLARVLDHLRRVGRLRD